MVVRLPLDLVHGDALALIIARTGEHLTVFVGPLLAEDAHARVRSLETPAFGLVLVLVPHDVLHVDSAVAVFSEVMVQPRRSKFSRHCWTHRSAKPIGEVNARCTNRRPDGAHFCMDTHTPSSSPTARIAAVEPRFSNLMLMSMNTNLTDRFDPVNTTFSER